MDDLQVIKQIEAELDIKLRHIKLKNTSIRNERIQHFSNKTYLLNVDNKIISLVMNSCEIKNLDRIAEPLSKLQSLTNLSLNANNLKSISRLKSLTNLTQLSLLGNNISEVSPLKNLKALKSLNLGRNNIKRIKPLIGLVNLQALWLITNQIEDLVLLNQFYSLKSLSIAENDVEDITFLKNLSNLERLDLQRNKIESLSALSNLNNLISLNLGNNVIKDLTGIESLKKVKFIFLQNNPLTELPIWITELFGKIQWAQYMSAIPGIFLYNNPINNPPLEIVKQGKSAIKRFFEKIIDEGVDYIYEAKITLVGEGNAGKTSLQKRLINSRAALPRKDNRTRGIEIKDWQFKKGKKHIAHIWDFGGQDVYYPVHRFFLTENSVFILLASTRQTTHNFDYWIPTIYQFGGNSPIILGQTCDKGNKISWSDLGVYLSNSNFNIVRTQSLPYFEIDLTNNNEGLVAVRNCIITQIMNLPHYGKGVPKSWVSIRNILHEVSKKESYISFEKFKLICKESNPKSFVKLTDYIDCCQFLHDIGVILWYANINELKNWVIMQPEWAMSAVYQIIDDSEIQKRRGNIIAKDFERLWQSSGYEEMHTILKKMLQIFKIAFPKKHIQDDYIIPVRLLSIPIEARWPDNESYLRLEYRYEFMPKGMINQLSAELSRYISSDDGVWNNAVDFSYKGNAECQVEELFYNRKITIKAKGRDARGLIILVMESLNNIIDDYKGVIPEIYVPCICQSCISSSRPTSFLYNDLLRWSENDDDAIAYCNEGRTSSKIEKLLHSVGLSTPENKSTEDKTIENRIITIFLASSSELKEDREQFEIFINRENKQLKKRGIFINLEIWEDFIDCISKTRLQDEYNSVIASSDIFVSLFFTKVGKFTSEEFDIAFGKFKELGKPLIYTYFKDGQINVNDIKKEDIVSKEKFQEKLISLEHFSTSYNNIEDLKYKFKMQLDKIFDCL